MDARQKKCSLATYFRCSIVFFICSCATPFKGQIKNVDGFLIRAEGIVNVVRLDSEVPYSNAVPVSSDGAFSVPDDLELGSYLVEAIVPGYQVHSKKINHQGKTDLTFQLKPLRDIEIESYESSTVSAQSRGGGRALLTPPKL